MKLKANTWYKFSVSVWFTEEEELPPNTLDVMEWIVQRAKLAPWWQRPFRRRTASYYLDDPEMREHGRASRQKLEAEADPVWEGREL